MPRAAAADFGVMQAAADGHTIEAFFEKPAIPPGRAGHPDEALVSMGVYVFDPGVLIEAGWRANGPPRPTTSGRTRSPGPANATAATGASWGQSIPISAPTWMYVR